MPTIKHKAHDKYGVTYGPEFVFVTASSEAEAMEAARRKLLRQHEDNLRRGQQAPADLRDPNLFRQIAAIHVSTR